MTEAREPPAVPCEVCGRPAKCAGWFEVTRGPPTGHHALGFRAAVYRCENPRHGLSGWTNGKGKE